MGLKSSPYEIFQFALYFFQGYKEGLADVQRDYWRFSSYTHSRHDTQVSFLQGFGFYRADRDLLGKDSLVTAI